MEYEIKGGAFPIVVCKLQKGERMKDECGSMAFMSSGVKMDTNTGGGVLKGLGRAISGNSFFIKTFVAEKDNQEIGFASNFPGKVIPIKLDGANSIIGQKRSFLASEDSVEIDMYFQKNLGTGIFGGEGFILQKFTGNGMLFLEIDGEVIERYLEPGEVLFVDQGHIAAMDESIDFDIERIKGAKNWLFGGEGVFFAKLVGPGRVWVQTMPITKLAQALIPMLPTKK